MLQIEYTLQGKTEKKIFYKEKEALDFLTELRKQHAQHPSFYMLDQLKANEAKEKFYRCHFNRVKLSYYQTKRRKIEKERNNYIKANPCPPVGQLQVRIERIAC